MHIGILGAGMIGATVGRLWVRAGHEVQFGTRHPDKLGALLAELGKKATAGKPEKVVAFGEAVLLAVPLKAVPELSAAAFAGKVVLDATNAYEKRDGDVAVKASRHPGGSSSWVAEQLPGARVVKAFNSVFFETLARQAHRPGDRVGIPLLGDDPAAVELAARLVRDAGFEPVPLGALAAGKRVEPGTKVYNTGASAAEIRRLVATSAG